MGLSYTAKLQRIGQRGGMTGKEAAERIGLPLVQFYAKLIAKGVLERKGKGYSLTAQYLYLGYDVQYVGQDLGGRSIGSTTVEWKNIEALQHLLHG